MKGRESESVRLFATPWTVACQAPLSMEFYRPENWSGQFFPSPVDLPNPGIEPRCLKLQADSALSEPPGKPKNYKTQIQAVQPTSKFTTFSIIKIWSSTKDLLGQGASRVVSQGPELGLHFPGQQLDIMWHHMNIIPKVMRGSLGKHRLLQNYHSVESF